MPWPSKRKRQLRCARNVKRQKQQLRNPPEERQDTESEDDAADEVGIEEYARDWVNSLDRDDLKSLSVLLHYLLVCLLRMGVTDASK